MRKLPSLFLPCLLSILFFCTALGQVANKPSLQKALFGVL